MHGTYKYNYCTYNNYYNNNYCTYNNYNNNNHCSPHHDPMP